MRPALLATWLALPLLSGCSALGLSSFEIVACADSAACLAVNNRNRVPADACERFVCEFPRDAMGRPIPGGTGTCVRGVRDDDADGAVNVACAVAGRDVDCDDSNPAVRGGAAEDCDGADNDCDGVVDEAPASPIGEARSIAAPLVSPVFTPDLGVLMGGPASARLIAGVPAEGAVTTTGAVYRMHAPPTDAEAHVCAPPRSGTISQTALVAGCPRYTADARPGEPSVTAASCVIAETALARSNTGLFVASVSESGCSAGQLRLGLMPSVAAGVIELRGPIGRSNVWLGVDLGADGCTGDGAARGVVGLTLETLPIDPDRALVTFLGAPADRGCDAGPAPVRILGIVRQMADAGATSVPVLNGSNGGVPEMLAMSSAMPGTTAALSGDAILVAYGAAGGTVEVARVRPWFPAPVLPNSASEAGDACISNEPVVTGALASPTVEWMLDAAGTVVAVDVATRLTGTVDELAVAYQVGCGTEAAIWFAMRDSVGASTASVRLGAGAEPQIVALEGVVTSTFSRGGRFADATTTGGYAVAYRAGDSFHVVRVAALDGLPLDGTAELVEGRDFSMSSNGAAWTGVDATLVSPLLCAPQLPAP